MKICLWFFVESSVRVFNWKSENHKATIELRIGVRLKILQEDNYELFSGQVPKLEACSITYKIY